MGASVGELEIGLSMMVSSKPILADYLPTSPISIGPLPPMTAGILGSNRSIYRGRPAVSYETENSSSIPLWALGNTPMETREMAWSHRELFMMIWEMHIL